MKIWSWVLGVGAATIVATVAWFGGFFDWLKSDKPQEDPVDITQEDRQAFHTACTINGGAISPQAIDKILGEVGLLKAVRSGLVTPDMHDPLAERTLGNITASAITLSKACGNKLDLANLKRDFRELLSAAEELNQSSITARPNPLIAFAKELVTNRAEFDPFLSRQSSEQYVDPRFSNSEASELLELSNRLYQMAGRHLLNTEIPSAEGYDQLIAQLEAYGPDMRAALSKGRDQALSEAGMPIISFTTSLAPFLGSNNELMSVERPILEIGR